VHLHGRPSERGRRSTSFLLAERLGRQHLSGSTESLPIVVPMSEKLLRLRYPATCSRCGGALVEGTEASWNRETKSATCALCLGAPNAATAAAAEAIKLRPGGGDRLDRLGAGRGGWLGGARVAPKTRAARTRDSLALRQAERHRPRHEPRPALNCCLGARRQRRASTRKLLDPLREKGIAVLHDRRIPRSKGNIDHLVVVPWGVFVVDAKNYKGPVEARDRGCFFSSDTGLYVGGRDKTALVAGMTKQGQAVRAALGDEHASVQICKTICFVDGDWSLFSRPIEIEGVHVLWPRALCKLIPTAGSLSRDEIAQIERKLASALPAA
jgi:hypothetical protein